LALSIIRPLTVGRFIRTLSRSLVLIAKKKHPGVASRVLLSALRIALCFITYGAGQAATVA